MEKTHGEKYTGKTKGCWQNKGILFVTRGTPLSRRRGNHVNRDGFCRACLFHLHYFNISKLLLEVVN